VTGIKAGRRLETKRYAGDCRPEIDVSAANPTHVADGWTTLPEALKAGLLPW